MMKYILALLGGITFLFMIVTPLIMTVSLKDSEDCMRVYTKMCQSSGICEGMLFTYDGMPGHIEHIKNVGYYSEKEVSGHSYGCIMYDRNIISAMQNTIYCSMVYLYY